jgi:N-acetylglutamate synthase-like GNAT family acetyltransferase
MLDYLSPEYDQMVALRQDVLRKPLGLQFTPEELARDEKDILIGAFDEEEILACCILTHAGNKICRLRQMAVRNSLQGKGIGASVLVFAENIARDRGFTSLFMHARASARGFYEKLGYQVCSDEFEEVSIPHYEMKKNL